MKFIKLLFLAISLFILAISSKALLGYWQYDEVAVDVAQMMLHQVSADDVRREVRKAIADDNPEEARMYMRLAGTFGYSIAPAEFEADLKRLETPLNIASRTVSNFATGFINGQAESGAGVAGAITSDFTVVGDARDLWEQYQLYAKKQPVDELVVTLAGLGVGLTAATVVTAGSTSPAKGGVSTFKVAAKGKRLTPAFQHFLLREGRMVFDYKAFMATAHSEKSWDGIKHAAVKAYNPQAIRTIEQTAEQANNIRKASSTGDAIHLLKYIDSGVDLARLERLSLKYGTETKGIMKFLGKSAIGTVKVLRKSIKLLISFLMVGFSSLASMFSLGGTLRHLFTIRPVSNG
jgi:hypothetical protein